MHTAIALILINGCAERWTAKTANDYGTTCRVGTASRKFHLLSVSFILHIFAYINEHNMYTFNS
jgi:hypothetical protein